MQSIMVMNIKEGNMGIVKKIWHWLFGKQEVESYEDIKAKCLEDVPATYNTGGYVKNAERYVAPSYSETISNNTVTRNNNDNFLTGAMVGYLFADSLNDNNTVRDLEETKSSNYESSYTPSSSSSYDSGSYSSSSDSGSSSSSCDSGC